MTLQEEYKEAKKEYTDALNAFNNAKPDYLLSADYRLLAAIERFNAILREMKAIS